MARTNAEAFGQTIYAAVFDGALTDESQCAGNRAGGSEPCRGSGRGFGTATQAGAEACFGGRSRSRKIANILLESGAGGTDRPAVHSAGEDSNEEASIESRVARDSGLRADLAVQVHEPPIQHNRISRLRWSFSDLSRGVSVSMSVLSIQLCEAKL